MSPVAACRICLAVDARLLAIEGPLQAVYEKITSNTLYTSDGRPVAACYICHAQLRKCRRLMLTSAWAEKVLNHVYETYSEISKESLSLVDCRHGQVLCGKLAVSVAESVATLPPGSRPVQIKIEPEDVKSTEEPGDHEEAIDPLDTWLDSVDLDTINNITPQIETFNDALDETDDESGQNLQYQDRVLREHTYAKRRRLPRATLQQLQTIVGKIEAQPYLNSRRSCDKFGINFDRAWKEVAQDLNTIKNGSTKNAKQWLTVWRYIKRRSCIKQAKLLQEKKAAVDLAVATASLTKLEKRVISIVKDKAAADRASFDFVPEGSDNDEIQEDTEIKSTTLQPDTTTEDHVEADPLAVWVDSVDLNTTNDIRSEQMATLIETGDEFEQPSQSQDLVVAKPTIVKGKQSSRATLLQYKALVATVEAQPFLDSRRSCDVLEKDFDHEWEKVAQDLNNIKNGPTKSGKQWLTAWRDYKSRTCIKEYKLRQQNGVAGDLATATASLTELQMRVMSIVRGKEAADRASFDFVPEDSDNVETQEDTGKATILQPVAAREDHIETDPLVVWLDSVDLNTTNNIRSEQIATLIETGDEFEQPSLPQDHVVAKPTFVKGRRWRAKLPQYKALVAKLEAQPFLYSRKSCAKLEKDFDHEWEKVAQDLNKINNGPTKSAKQWMTVWRDFKSRTCMKEVKLLQGKRTASLTELENRVISIVRNKGATDRASFDSVPEGSDNDKTQEDTDIKATTLQPVAAIEETGEESGRQLSQSQDLVVAKPTIVKGNRSLRASLSQFKALVAKIEAQPFLDSKRSCWKLGKNFDRAWKKVAKDLNKIKKGPAKNAKQWFKVWCDFKSRTCLKKAKLLKDAGDLAAASASLTELQRRVMSFVRDLNTTNIIRSEQIATLVETSEESGRQLLQTQNLVVAKPTIAKGKSSLRATLSQCKALLAKIEAQPFLITRRSCRKFEKNFDHEWKKVAQDLNKLKIGPTKNSKQWFTVWRDIKFRTCRKEAKFLQKMRAAGDLSVATAPLTELQRRVMAIVRDNNASDRASFDNVSEESDNDETQEDTEIKATTLQPVSATEDHVEADPLADWLDSVDLNTTSNIRLDIETSNDAMDETVESVQLSQSQDRVVAVQTEAKPKRAGRVKLSQLEALVAKIEANPFMMSKKIYGIAGYANYNLAWKELAQDLNKMKNGVTKTAKQWIWVWLDFKSRSRKKAAKLVCENRADNLVAAAGLLTELEKRVVSVSECALGRSSPDFMSKLSGNDIIQEDIESTASTQQPIRQTEDSTEEAGRDLVLPSQSPGVAEPTVKRKRSGRANEFQIEALVARLEAQPLMICRLLGGTAGRGEYDRAWHELAQQLNDMIGGAYKSTARWQAFWRDLKCRILAKEAKVRAAESNKAIDTDPLSEFEERVLSLANFIGLADAGNNTTQDAETRATTQQPVATKDHEIVLEDFRLDSVAVDNNSEIVIEILDETNGELVSRRLRSQAVPARARRSRRVTLLQLENLVGKVEEQPSLNSMRFGGKVDDENNKLAWKEVAITLNGNGAVKNSKQWHTTWRKFRSRTCKKAFELLRKMKAAGNSTASSTPLTELESRVISIVKAECGVRHGFHFLLRDYFDLFIQDHTETRISTQQAVAATEDGASAQVSEDGKRKRAGKEKRPEENVTNKNELPTLLHNSKKQTREGRHVCHVCQRSFGSAKGIRWHLNTHSGEKPYECNDCQFKCFDRSNLIRHIRTHTGEKPHECNVCHARFIQSSGLKSHMRIHTGEKPYECNVCQERFTYRNRLKSHLRKHTGEKPYECNICRNLFRDEVSLENHLKTHTGEKQRIKSHECNICQKLFSEKSSLKDHVMIHTGEKPYECKVCQRRFRRRNALVSHLKIHSR